MSTEDPEQSLRTGDGHSAEVLPRLLSSDLTALRLSSAGPGAVLELVAGVELRVIARAGLPHFPEDF